MAITSKGLRMDRPALHQDRTCDQLVFIPGLACTEDLFADQIRAVSGAVDVHVAETSLDPSIALMATRILDEVSGSFAVVGLSMGGYVALEIMRQGAGRVTHLALMDTVASADAPAARETRLKLIEAAQRERLDEVHRVLWPRLVASARHQDRALEERVLAMLLATGSATFERQQHAIMNRADSRDLLRGITVPTLVVVGAEDVITPPEAVSEMAASIAGSKLVVLKDCGHLSTMEAPEMTTRALEEWLGIEKVQ